MHFQSSAKPGKQFVMDEFEVQIGAGDRNSSGPGSKSRGINKRDSSVYGFGKHLFFERPGDFGSDDVPALSAHKGISPVSTSRHRGSSPPYSGIVML